MIEEFGGKGILGWRTSILKVVEDEKVSLIFPFDLVNMESDITVSLLPLRLLSNLFQLTSLTPIPQ